MNFNEKWEIVKEIGEGGQGKVYQVFDKSIKKETDHIIADFLNSIKVAHIDIIQKNLDKFFDLVSKRLSIQDISFHKALKVLHKPLDSRDYKLAKDRIETELKAMRDIQHPHLLRIVDYDSDEDWFVSDYYPNGSLDKIFDRSRGNVLYSLKLIRPIVEAVSLLHKNNYVHRDIKPENIFIGSNNDLVLGDFGLVFFDDEKHTRISNTFSNVGSRDWMPPWAMGKRIDKINPTFDVFSLGKIIWSMISGIPILQLWYFDAKENNLDSLFAKSKEMKVVNKLLSKCIVEKEENCLSDGSELLSEIDSTIEKLEFRIETIGFEENRTCKVCGKGSYVLQSNSKKNDHNFGLSVSDHSYYLIYVCNHCGNTQLFYCSGGVLPDAWKS